MEPIIAALSPKKKQDPRHFNPRLQQLIDKNTQDGNLIKLEKRLEQIQDNANCLQQVPPTMRCKKTITSPAKAMERAQLIYDGALRSNGCRSGSRSAGRIAQDLFKLEQRGLAALLDGLSDQQAGRPRKNSEIRPRRCWKIRWRKCKKNRLI